VLVCLIDLQLDYESHSRFASALLSLLGSSTTPTLPTPHARSGMRMQRRDEASFLSKDRHQPCCRLGVHHLRDCTCKNFSFIRAAPSSIVGWPCRLLLLVVHGCGTGGAGRRFQTREATRQAHLLRGQDNEARASPCWSLSPLQASAAHHCTLPTTEHLPPPWLMHLRPARRKGCTVRACARPGANWSGGYCTDYRPRPQLPADGNGARGKAFDLVGESLSTPMEKEPYQRGSYNHKQGKTLYRCGTLHYLHKISTNFYWSCEVYKSVFSDATSQNCLK
jgi:hypothetical protein